MRYRVIDINNHCWPTYFKTKKEAVLYLEEHKDRYEGKIQHKVGGNWFDY